ncbi:hypothetical protein [Pseudonocardia sp. NPDC049154]|uniref:hypothetical protein n=1 Tax=Pseudonocardia sp. NPDC049154 TaxID=3155501 RepID=UPI0033E7AEBD
MSRRTGRWQPGRDTALDAHGARPLTRHERSALAHLEHELRSPDRCVPADRTAHAGADEEHASIPEPGERRLACIAGVIGVLLHCGMVAEAALVGGTVLALGVAITYLVLLIAFVGVECRRRRHRR